MTRRRRAFAWTALVAVFVVRLALTPVESGDDPAPPPSQSPAPVSSRPTTSGGEAGR